MNEKPAARARRLRDELDRRLEECASLPVEPRYRDDYTRPSLAAFVAARAVGEAIIATGAPLYRLNISATYVDGFLFSLIGDTENEFVRREIDLWIESDGSLNFVPEEGKQVLTSEDVKTSIDQIPNLVAWLFRGEEHPVE